MPINRLQLADTSAFQRNCALNPLLHKILQKVNNNSLPDKSLQKFNEAYNVCYKTALDINQFKAMLLTLKNPYQAEVLLGETLRSMLLLPEATAPWALEPAFPLPLPKVLKPGEELYDTDIIPLANFFGIKVETYSDTAFKRKVLAECNKKNKQFLGADLNPKQKADLDASLSHFQGRDEDYLEIANTMISFVPPNVRGVLEAGGWLNPADIINELKAGYAELNHDLTPKAIADAQNKLLKNSSESNAPLKLFDTGKNHHFKYEAASAAEKMLHDNCYPKSYDDENQYWYGSNHHNRHDGFPDMIPLKQRINAAFNQMNGEKNAHLNVPKLLKQYEIEAMARRKSSSAGNSFGSSSARQSQPRAQPQAQQQFQSQSKSNSHEKAAQNESSTGMPPLLSALNKVVGGGLFSDFSKKIFSAVMEPFKSRDKTYSPNNTGKNSQSKSRTMASPSPWLDILFGVYSFIKKIARSFVNLKTALMGEQTKIEREKNPSADLTPDELGDHLDGPIFLEYASYLSDASKARLNNLWLKSSSKEAVMDQLGYELEEQGFKDELEFFDFKRKLQNIKNNEALRLHLSQRWQEEVYAKRHNLDPIISKQVTKTKAELNGLLDNVLNIGGSPNPASQHSKSSFDEGSKKKSGEAKKKNDEASAGNKPKPAPKPVPKPETAYMKMSKGQGQDQSSKSSAEADSKAKAEKPKPPLMFSSAHPYSEAARKARKVHYESDKVRVEDLSDNDSDSDSDNDCENDNNHSSSAHSKAWA